ncbi:probable cytochrome P450 6a14 [Phlebotomus papatasi]|uniref:probable cytochrome P450 6a14 n=1 Tax=Phlebotomus papatasi TaxID=29031 RepID=UPI0024838BE5|nr:probable cytochrome P450 6a14 [Phlebotomus papatasi]
MDLSLIPVAIVIIFMAGYLYVKKKIEYWELREQFAKKKETIEIKNIFSLFTTDVIGNCAFGIECNSFKKPNTEFRRIGKRLFEFTFLEAMRVIFSTMFQDFSRMLKMKIIKTDVAEFFMRFFKEIVEYREKNDIKRDDFLSLLMQIKNTGKLDGDSTGLGKITFEELVAQMYAIFNASYETTSSTLTLAVYELAQHQDIQEKAREEVNRILKKYNDEYTYEACTEMKYIDQIIKETLRKYPVIDYLLRLCGQDYSVPNTNHVIDKGTYIAIPVHAIHHDPEIYPDPEKFDPERFTEDNIKNRHPYAWLPFGEGPRNCIAMRLGMVQAKIGLASLLSKYRVNVSPRTVIPPVFNYGSFTLSPKDGMWITLEMAT